MSLLCFVRQGSEYSLYQLCEGSLTFLETEVERCGHPPGFIRGHSCQDCNGTVETLIRSF